MATNCSMTTLHYTMEDIWNLGFYLEGFLHLDG